MIGKGGGQCQVRGISTVLGVRRLILVKSVHRCGAILCVMKKLTLRSLLKHHDPLSGEIFRGSPVRETREGGCSASSEAGVERPSRLVSPLCLFQGSLSLS